MAVCDGEHWLSEQVESVLGQTGVDLVLFVSVDVSSDGSLEWIERAARRDPRIRVLPAGQAYGSAAANFFRLLNEVDLSGIDYVALADQDDIWFPDKLARAADVLHRHAAAAYSSNVLAFWPDGRRVLVDKAQPQRRWDHLFEAAGPGCTYVLATALVEHVRAVLLAHAAEARQIGLHDWFLYAFARANGYRWVIDERPGLLYRQHDRNLVGVNMGVPALLRRVGRVRNGWALDQAGLIARLTGANRDPQISRWLRGGRLGVGWLALHAGQCRRRPRDRVYFFFSCLLSCVTGRVPG